MPRMNGLQAARILRSWGSDLPIILFTMHAETISDSDASAAGITSVVSKMASISELSKCVEGLLRNAAASANPTKFAAPVHSPEEQDLAP